MYDKFKKLTESKASYGMTILRIMLGIILIAHGSQKLFGIFGGYGLEGTGKFMDSIGLHPGYIMALLAGAGEFVSGSLLLLGLFSRIGALIAVLISIVALLSVHIHNGFFMSNNGFEYILLLLIASATILIEGGGKLRLEQNLFK